MFAGTIAKVETSGASHGECKNTNRIRHDGAGGRCLNPLKPVAGSAANKMRNTDPKLGNKVGMNSNAITLHPPTASQLSVKQSREFEEVNQPPAKRLSLLSWKESTMKQDRNLRECAGIPGRANMHGLNMSPEGSTDLLCQFNFINGRFCRKECCGVFNRNHLMMTQVV
jgi:hypothetical protein